MCIYIDGSTNFQLSSQALSPFIMIAHPPRSARGLKKRNSALALRGKYVLDFCVLSLIAMQHLAFVVLSSFVHMLLFSAVVYHPCNHVVHQSVFQEASKHARSLIK